MSVCGLVPLGCMPPACASDAGWLAAAICVAVVGFALLPCRSPLKCSLISSFGRTARDLLGRIWRCLLILFVDAELRRSEWKMMKLGSTDYSINKASVSGQCGIAGKPLPPSFRSHGGERGRSRAVLCDLSFRCCGDRMLLNLDEHSRLASSTSCCWGSSVDSALVGSRGVSYAKLWCSLFCDWRPTRDSCLSECDGSKLNVASDAAMCFLLYTYDLGIASGLKNISSSYMHPWCLDDFWLLRFVFDQFPETKTSWKDQASLEYIQMTSLHMSEFHGSDFHLIEHDLLLSSFGCTRLHWYDGEHGEDIVPVVVRVEPPVINDNTAVVDPQIQRRGLLRLSSVRDIQYL